MKKLSILGLALSLTFFSCSSDDGGSNTDNPSNSGYAMTAKINGTVFQANNPFGTNAFSSTNIWNYFPEADYVMLQGRQGGVWGNPEINIWLKKTDIQEGTYTIGQETFSTPPSHFIDLTDIATEEFQYTKEGSITITEVNTSTHIVKGTFNFKTADDLDGAPINNVVTEGTFRYTYE